MFKKILVPLDGSQLSQRSLEPALVLSRQTGAKLLVSVPTADSVLEYVETYGIDLIAMATHGPTGLKRWVYGSVTAKVLRSASCSLLVVRPTDAELN